MKNTEKKFFTPHIFLLIGWFFIALSVILNIWIIELVFVPDSLIEWPNSLYIYIFQSVLLLIGIVFIFININFNYIKKYFFQTDIKTLSLNIFLLLLFIDLLLQVLFLMTVNHPGYSDLGLLFTLFHLSIEKNFPSTYSAIQAILAAIMALCCIKFEKKFLLASNKTRYVWIFVAIVLFYIGIDEYFSFHENAGIILYKCKLTSSDFNKEFKGFCYAWTVVAGVISLIIGIVFFIFFAKIFSKYRYLLCLLVFSGGIFLFGAIGMENFQVYIDTYGLHIDKNYVVMLEEFFEMFGVSIAVFVFIRYCGELRLSSETKTKKINTSRGC